MTHMFGHALSYLDRELPPACQAVLEGVRSASRGASPNPASTADVVSRLNHMVSGANATVELRHAWPVGFTVDLPFRLVTEARRHWPSPIDVELLGLEHDRRVLIKREYVSDGQAQAWEQSWASSGVTTCRAPTPGHSHRWTLFGAKHGDVLAEATVRELALTRHGTAEAEAATAWLGGALGYPACCVQAYLKDGRRDDLYALARCLPRAPSPAAPAVSLALNPLLNLISYIPCGPRCAATAELGSVLHRGIAGRDPGFSARWGALAERLHVVDQAGRHAALSATAEVDGIRVTGSVTLELGPDGRVQARPDPAAEGRLLRPYMGGLRADDGMWAVLVADHRP